jgi:hypothetical protein
MGLKLKILFDLDFSENSLIFNMFQHPGALSG